MVGRGGRRRLGGRRAPAAEPGSALAARTRALGLLGRRDYARAALKQRLTEDGFEPGATEAALSALERERLLSDARYAEAAVASRIARGHGPLRIALELRRQGLASGLVKEALAAHDTEWPALAAALRRRRFGPAPAGDAPGRAREARFLLARGFTGRQVSAALGAAGRDEFAELELREDEAPGGAGPDAG